MNWWNRRLCGTGLFVEDRQVPVGAEEASRLQVVRCTPACPVAAYGSGGVRADDAHASVRGLHERDTGGKDAIAGVTLEMASASAHTERLVESTITAHGPFPAAFHVMAKPTGARCNLQCDYCFFLEKASLYPGSEFRMSDEVMRGSIAQIVAAQRLPADTRAWQGGEPTLMGLDGAGDRRARRREPRPRAPIRVDGAPESQPMSHPELRLE